MAATFPLDEQEADQNFDFAVIASLGNDVVPHLGDPRLPDEVVVKLGQTLQRGSTIYGLEVCFGVINFAISRTGSGFFGCGKGEY
jgi:hypothetical protein